MRNYFLIIFSLVFFACCNGSGNAAGSGEAPVTGKLENAQGKTIVFEQLTATSVVPLDTLNPDEEGNFEINYDIPEPGFYRIFADQQNFVILVLDTTGTVTVNGDAAALASTVKVKGNEETERLQSLYAEMGRRDRYRDSLEMVLQTNANNQNVEELRANLQEAYEQNELVRKEYLKNYIAEDPSSLTNLIAISSLSYEEDPKLFKRVHDEMPKRYPNSDLVQPFLQAYQEMTRTAAGEMAPDIVMPTPEGNTLKLSDLRGKYVLVDFWASWCKPCRIENPNVVRVYNEYKDKGFEILGVSLDRERDLWLQAIKDDKLTWKHMSDLSFWNSPVVKAYGISGIPYTVLVDPEGKIVAKGLRGAALEKKLAELFN